MAKITYPQQLPEDANSIKHVSIGQTRDGKDEWITPVTMWERNKSSGLYLPPGVLSDDDVAIPRVKAQLYGTIPEQVELQTELLSTIAYNTGMNGIKVSSWANVQHIVRAGLHHQVFQIGDQFMDTAMSM